MTLFMFAVTFADGVPDGYQVFDGEGKRIEGLSGETLAEALIEGGIIHHDSQTSLDDFCRGIQEGKRYGGMLVLCRSAQDGVIHWARISFLMTYDESGAPLRASGSIRELPHIATAQGRFFREEKLFESVGGRLLRAVSADLTADIVEDIYPAGIPAKGTSYEALVASTVSKCCYADDAVEIARMMTRENILKAIDDGAFQMSKEFRREDAGRIRWTSIVVHLVENPANRHMVGFVYVADIERRHVEVAFASAFAKPDKVSGLFTRDSLDRMVASLQCAETTENPLAAVAVIRVAMPADLRALLSAEDANSGQVYLGQQLAVCLAQEGLVARYGADGFLVLFPRVDSENWVRLRVNEAIADLRKAYVDKEGGTSPAIAGRTRDVLTGLPNKLVFDRNAITFDPTMFHSVGVLRLGIERSYTREGERDVNVEGQQLLYAARNLSGLFPLDSVYRTGELQLTCVCANMAYDAFNARTTRMVAIMRQRMHSGFALCDAWSDNMPSLTKLLETAATSVYGDRSILFPEERSESGVSAQSHRVFDGDAFSIRLRPQVDLKTGEVIGSEALARCLTPDGELIPPPVGVHPAHGGRRRRVHAGLLRVRKSAFHAVVVDGARVGALAGRGQLLAQDRADASFIASVLAIASRYDVPENLLEIEITESLGSFKSVQLRTAMDVLRDQGFRFALDDLGSEYSTLSAMSDLPFDTVKLDRLLVKRFIDDSMSSSHRGGNRACLREERHPLRGGGRRAALLHRTAGVFGMPIRSGVLLRAPDDRRPVHQRVPCAKRRHRGCQSHPAA